MNGCQQKLEFQGSWKGQAASSETHSKHPGSLAVVISMQLVTRSVHWSPNKNIKTSMISVMSIFLHKMMTEV